jgi:hypothetical protein
LFAAGILKPASLQREKNSERPAVFPLFCLKWGGRKHGVHTGKRSQEGCFSIGQHNWDFVT